MSVVRQILCLANSKKMSGRCVAGRQIVHGSAGPWIRPVSDRATQEVSENERQYENGSDPRVLDVVNVPLIDPCPHACQTENWLLDPWQYWVRVRRIGWDELQAYVENPRTLWINGRRTYNGFNDEIPCAEADALPRSLYLIHVTTLQLSVFAPSATFGNPKRRVLASFQHRGVRYSLWVTDPLVEREYLARDNGDYPLGECCLCISLGEPFSKGNQEYRYKLVASIIQRAVVRP